MNFKNKKSRLKALTLAANLLLAVGIFAPCLTVIPKFGEFSALVNLFNSDYSKVKTISIISGIYSLLVDDNLFIGLLILVFSVVFPVWKVGVIWATISADDLGKRELDQLNLMDKLSKLSMLDVFVLALIVIILKGMPGGTEVQLEWGVYSFAVSIILTLLLPKMIKPKMTRSDVI